MSRGFPITLESWGSVARPLLRYDPGTELFRQGSVPHALFVLQRGWVKLARLEANGAEGIIDVLCGPDILGSCAAILGRPHPYTARTITHCTAICVPAAVFKSLVETSPDCTLQALFHHCHALYEGTFRIAELACLDARERMEYVISRLMGIPGASCRDQGLRARFPLRDHELADLLSITPEHLSRLLHQMMREGILARERGWIVVIDQERLRSREARNAAPVGQRTSSTRVFS